MASVLPNLERDGIAAGEAAIASQPVAGQPVSSPLLLAQAASPGEDGGDAQSGDAQSGDAQPPGDQPVERPTLTVGSEAGPLVIQVHVLLQQQGYYSGDINSNFSSETAEAVKAFQLKNNLEPTGAVDSATWGPLTGETEKPPSPETGAGEAAGGEAAGGDGPGDEAGAQGEESPRRLIILAIALVGLGAGGFGLWKILSVPIPKPFSDQAPSDADSNLGSATSAELLPAPLGTGLLPDPGALASPGSQPGAANAQGLAHVPQAQTSRSAVPLTAAQVAIAAQSAATQSAAQGTHGRAQPPLMPGAARASAARPAASQDPSNPSAHPAAPPGQLSPSAPDPALATSPHSLTPPPPPSEIAWAGPPGSLEQPDLVTSRLARVDIVEVLVTDLQSVDPAKRRKAIWELGQRSDSRAIQPLVNLMASSDSRQRSLILSALSEIGTQTLKPMKQALAISLQDENPEVRKNAIRDLTRIYDLVAQISHLLNAALEDSDPEVQETARWALKQLNRIRSTTAIEGSQPQQVLQQSVSPPESFAEDRPGQS